MLSSVVVDAEIDTYGQKLETNPCMACKLCVSVCPVGAISPDGSFDFPACYTHNYREFMSGFTDWAQTVADSSNAAEYGERVSDGESASMWQSLSFGANYKAAYCMAVCPAGTDVIGPYLEDRRAWMRDIVRPLQHKEETVYVSHGSRAAEYVRKRFPHKTVREIDNGLGRPESPAREPGA